MRREADKVITKGRPEIIVCALEAFGRPGAVPGAGENCQGVILGVRHLLAGKPLLP